MTQPGVIVKRYLSEWPTLPSLTLSKKIYNENKEYFRDVEIIRSLIRAYRGKHGEGLRKAMKSTEFYNQQYSIPETHAPDYTPYILPAEATNVLILSDLHIPFHDPEAIEQAVRWGKAHEVNTVVLNGDTVDCYQLSRFIKDARYPRLEEEIGAVSEFLDYLRAEFPEALIVWKNGNHDERLEAWMKVKNPELLNVLSWQYNDLPQLRRHFEDRMVYVTDKRKVMAGKLTILHGHEFQSKATGQVNPARSLFLKTYQSAMVGHHHITSEHTDKKLDNEIITCWSVGCLCGLWPEYARINRWNHGFARVKVATDGTFKVANIRIIDGKIY